MTISASRSPIIASIDAEFQDRDVQTISHATAPGRVTMPQGMAVLDLVLGDRFDARAGRIDGTVALVFENLLFGLTTGFVESRIGIGHRFLGTVVGRIPDGE